MKRTDWIIGGWYYHPRMEANYETKARYVKIAKADSERFPSCTAFIFDEYILADGTRAACRISQSNNSWETGMEHVPDAYIENIIKGLPYGI